MTYMTMDRSNITDIPIDRISSLVEDLGMKPYAAGQIISWLYKKRVSSFGEMTNLSSDGRRALKEKFEIPRPVLKEILEAEDKTEKLLFSLADGSKIESVLIFSEKGRVTLCISTQVGCAMGCGFCRTGEAGFVRDLSQGEILGQLIEAERLCEKKGVVITNIVLMGMGEPFANYNNVASAVRIMLDERAFNFSKRRITLSTSGLIPQLEKFSKEFDIKLAISLNATDDKTRDRIMPINKRYSLDEIISFCRSYSKSSKNRITFEYVMIDGVNDTKADMEKLLKLLKGVRAKINLIPFNTFPGCDFKGSSEETVKKWHDFLASKGVQINIRISRGQNILAACGQLAT